MRPALAACAALCVLACSLPAAAMTRAEYTALRSRIQDKYATDEDRCVTRAPRQRDACEVQARVAYDIARFELRAQYRPSPRNVQKAQRAKADARLALEESKCADLRAGARAICLEEARSRWSTAHAEASAPALQAR
jgi:hypothetical protein